MTADDDSDDGDGVTRTTVEVDRAVWREVRSDAVGDGVTISEKLEDVLAEYYEVET